MRKQRGFTLIEIAIVLVIIGLLLGGVLKGQELITSARVRNLISQQDGVKAAYFGFLDRFRALPGDYSQAAGNINCGTGTPCTNGNNNGRIESVVLGGAVDEQIAVWEHLSKAGFINGSYTYAVKAGQGNQPVVWVTWYSATRARVIAATAAHARCINSSAASGVRTMRSSSM